jgi:hypothetical protein
MRATLSPRSFAAKLGYRPGAGLSVLGASDEWLRRLQAEVGSRAPLKVGLPPGEALDLVLWWPGRPEELPATFDRLKARLGPRGSIWAVVPNRAAAKRLHSRLSFEAVQQAALSLGLVDTKVLKFSDDEYGVRFSVRREAQPSTR